MVSFTVHIKFAPQDRAEIAEILPKLTLASRQEPGCITYIPHHVQDDPDTIVFYEQYRDQAALDAHHESEHFKKYVIAGLLQKMKERSREDLIALL